MMRLAFDPFRLLLISPAGWVNQRQQDVIDYLQEENRVLREQLGGKRLPFNDDQGSRSWIKISLTDQEAFRGVTEVASDLAHPEPIAIPGDSGDLNPSTRQIDQEEHEEPRQTSPSPTPRS